ncbi:MAG: phosphate signaling complex protein PhoU [Thermoflexales bacterium]|nr:phosphate signaling complex protein PhoU [Thermoflexales bacterium]
MSTLHLRSALEHELELVRQDILRMGSMVERAIERSIQALRDRDPDLAQQVINDDAQINAMRYKLEEACLEVLATQQPAAGDLRALVAALHIAVELERMGDHAEGIAKLTIRMVDQPLLKPLVDIPRMAEICREMISTSLTAYVNRDVELAKAVAARDDEVDALYQQTLRELLTYMIEDPKNISRATFLLWVTHNLERVGDRVTNVCERVVFMTTGQLKEIS